MKIKRFEQINENHQISRNDDEIYEFNLRYKDIREIILLIMEKSFDLSKYDKSKINLSVKENQLNGKYILVDIPFPNKTYTEYQMGFEIKIYEDGFISYENGNDVIMKFNNALKIYKILLDRIK